MKSNLVDGLIPKGSPCPWYASCAMQLEKCPTLDKPSENDFSCAMARLNEMNERKRLKVVL